MTVTDETRVVADHPREPVGRLLRDPRTRPGRLDASTVSVTVH